MNVVGYVRVSTKEQVEGYSLSTQREDLERFCQKNGWTLTRVFSEEGESAKTADRPQLIALLEHCRTTKAVGMVLAHRVDRIARNQHDYHVIRMHLAKLDVVLRSSSEPIDDSPQGRLMENMLSAMAQFDNDVRAARTRDGMKAATSAGRWMFKAPIGYIKAENKGATSLIPDPKTADHVRGLFTDFATGMYTKVELLQRHTARGLTAANGRGVTAQNLDRILRNVLYCGRVRVTGWELDVRGDFEPLIDEDVFTRVQAILDRSNAKNRRRVTDHPDFPLRRFVRCHRCTLPLTGSFATGRRGGKYGYYHCRRNGCELNVSKATLETSFLRCLSTVVPRPSLLRLFREIILDVWKERHGEVQKEKAQLQARRTAIRARKDRLVEAHVHKGTIDAEVFAEHMKKLSEEDALARMQMHDTELEDLDVDAVLSFAETTLTDPAVAWERMTLAQRQRFQTLVFPEGVTFDGETFRTPKLSPVFEMLRPVSANEPPMASLTRPSWNQVAEFLRDWDGLRSLAA